MVDTRVETYVQPRKSQSISVYDDPVQDELIQVTLHLPRGHIDALNDRKIDPSDLCYRLIHGYITDHDRNVVYVDELLKLFDRQEKIIKEIYKLESYTKELDFIEHEIDILLEKVYDVSSLTYDKATIHSDIKFIYRKVSEGFTPAMIQERYPKVITRMYVIYPDFNIESWVRTAYKYLPKSIRSRYRNMHLEMVRSWERL